MGLLLDGLGVYPRVGGETAGMPTDTLRIHGLSPRGRGNQQLDPARPGRDGSIPAWAGKPTYIAISS